MNDRQESIHRLEDIMGEIDELANEAYEIVRQEDSTEGSRAHAYWLPHIVGALRNETEWLGGSMTTMEDSIDSLRNGDQMVEEELCPECDDDTVLASDEIEGGALYCPKCRWSQLDGLEE